jgi:hypothetical protein
MKCVIEFKGKTEYAKVSKSGLLTSDFEEAKVFESKEEAQEFLKGRHYRRKPQITFLF